MDEMQNTLNSQRIAIKQLEAKMESFRQREKINNVCVYGVEESDGEIIEEKMIKLFTQKLKVNTSKEYMIKCYRVGENREKPRPVIVKFADYNKKVSILKNKSNLKGTKIGLMEELTKSRFFLYKTAQKKVDWKRVFTRDGNILVRREDGRNHKIRDLEDLDAY